MGTQNDKQSAKGRSPYGLSCVNKFVIELMNPKNVIESVLPSFADVFFCSLPIHRLFSKAPDKSGNYIIFENTNRIFWDKSKN